jgi:ribosomal protein S18 acetylase RimI-like enzyme
VRCSDHPGFWDYNCLRLEVADPGVSADDLAAEADRLEGDLRHRRMEVEHEEAGRRLRPGFEALGWRTSRLVWMTLSEPPPGPDFEEVPMGLTRPLRLDWSRSEGLELSERDFQRQANAEEDVARRRGIRALVARDEAGEPTAYALFQTDGDTAEVEQVYVKPAQRGRGTGGALVAAAARAGGATGTFIVADDEGDPKRLYERLGFRPVWIQHEYTRRPSAAHA